MIPDLLTHLVSSTTPQQWLVFICTTLSLLFIRRLCITMLYYKGRWLETREQLRQAREDAEAWREQAEAWMKMQQVEPPKREQLWN